MNEDSKRDTIQSLWQRIEHWLSRHAPHAWQMLRPGASEQEIQQAEVTLGTTLPEDFKASCRIHNGGYALDLITEMEMLPLEEVVSEWQILKDCLEDEEWANAIPEHFTEDRSRWPTVPLQLVWWHPQWIPFGSDSAGNCCCLDLAPTPGGSVGQVIDWDHEVGPTQVLASSFLEVLSTFAHKLEAGEYVDTATGLVHCSQREESGEERIAIDPNAIRVETRSPQPTASIRTIIPLVEIGTTVVQLLSEIRAYMEEHGLPAAGNPPFVFLRCHEHRGEHVDLEVGVSVAEIRAGVGRVMTGELPGGDMVTIWYIGSHELLSQAYQAIERWSRDSQRELAGIPWVAYGLNRQDPRQIPDFSSWAVHVQWLLKK